MRPPRPSGDGDPVGSDDLIGAGLGEMDRPLDIDMSAEVFHHDSVSDCPQPVAGESSGGLDGALSLNDIRRRPGAGEASGWEDSLEYDLSLREHLHAQAGIVLSGHLLFIGRHLIELIDENGYLRGDLLQVSHQLGVPLGEVEAALAAIHTLEPTGVGARDLAECLALQAKEADRYDPCMARLIDNLELLARGALPQLKRLCRVDDEDLADMIAELRQYDPKPGSRFGGSSIESVVPDLFVLEREGKWVIEINSATLPRLLVNRSYHVSLSGGRHDAKSKAWLSECMAEANWLVKALDQRQRTIIKVASEIVKQQEGFFRQGVTQLRPLTLRSVADAIEMHESTVSRVTSHKYLSCARGLYRTQILLHQRDPGDRWRRCGVRLCGEEPHQGADRRGGRQEHPVRRSAGRSAEGARLRHRPAHGGEIPRGAGAGLVGTTPPPEEAAGGAVGSSPLPLALSFASLLMGEAARLGSLLPSRSGEGDGAAGC